MPSYDKMHAAVQRIQKLSYSFNRLQAAHELLESRIAGTPKYTADGSVHVTVRSQSGNSPNLEHEDLTGVDIHTVSMWDRMLAGHIEKRMAQIKAEILEIERTT